MCEWCECSAAAKFGLFMSDIEKGLPVILVCGAGGAFLLGLLWLVFVKWCGGFLVWLTIWATIAVAVIVTIVAYFRAGILTKALINSAVRCHPTHTHTHPPPLAVCASHGVWLHPYAGVQHW